MKEIWKKTSLFYKIIAVLLTVVMVGTTMYFHFEKKYVAKAEGAEDWINAITIKKMILSDGGNVNTLGDWQEVTEDVNLSVNSGRTYAYFVYITKTGWTNINYNYNSTGEAWNGGNVTFHDGDTCIIKVDVNINSVSELKVISVNDGTNNYDLNKSSIFVTYIPADLAVTATIGSSSFSGEIICGAGSELEVTVTSGWDIQSLTILDKTLTAEELSSALTVDANNHINTVTYRYKFDDETSNTNKKYTNLDIRATDNNTDSTKNNKTILCTSLLYDRTAPVITETSGPYDGSWKQSYTYNYTITSGETTDESLLDGDLNIVFSNYKDTATNIVQPINNLASVSQNVPIPESYDVNGTKVAFTAKDKAGNEIVNETKIFYIDNTKPVNSDINITVTGDKEATDANFIRFNSSDDIDVAVNASDNILVKKIKVELYDSTGTNKLGEGEKSFDGDGTDPNEAPAQTKAYTFKIKEMYPALVSGDYVLKVIVTDAAGNTNATPVEKNVHIDIDKPTVTLNEIQYKDATNGWILIPDGERYTENGNNIYFLNQTVYPDGVRYLVSISDVGNHLDTTKIKVVDENGNAVDVNVAAATVDANGNGSYYIYVTPDKMNPDNPLKLKITASDSAGNESDSVNLEPDTQLLDEDIKLNVTLYYNGEVVDINNIEKTVFDGNYTIKVSAQSGFEFVKLELRQGDTTYVSHDTLTDRYDANTGIHYVDEYEFTLPKDIDINEAFEDLKVYVENTNPDDNKKSKTTSIGILMYDNTDPTVENTGDAIENKWYQEYSLNYEIVSGNGSVESDLDKAEYTLSGSKNDGKTDAAISGKKASGTIDVPESSTTTGSSVTFAAQDKATNTMTSPGNIFNIKVDKTAPTVATIKVDGKEATAATVLAGKPQLTSTITDNLTIKDYMVTVKYNDESDVYAVKAVNVNKDATEESINYTIEQLLGSKELKDGKYTVSISAKDKSDRGSNVSSTSFIVDNTAPVVTANILSGTTGKNNGYYNSDVVVRLTCKDNNFNPAAMSVTDNGSAISADWKTGNDMYYADVTLSAEGLHNIRVSGNDKAGTAAQAKQVTFTIDKTVPTVSLLVNGGQIYNESRGTLNLTGPLTFTASVSDTNEDAGDLRVQVIKTVPDTATTTSEFLPTGERTFTFADEADYVINIFAIDKANNQGPTRTISFRVDTTAPQLTITGAGGTAASATSVSFNITEAFWSDAKGTVEIYRKAGDGVDEALYKTLTISPTQRAYSLSELLRESGIYRFEFTADDKVGHTATTSQKITVDVNKPEITLSGVNNYDSTDGAVSISAIIKDEFYASKKVSIQGTRTDAAGKKTALSFSPFAATANPTTINDTFSEEGIYDITLTATDIAGNVTSNSVHFTIDTSDPVIGDLSMYDGKTFNAKSFEDIGLDIDLDEIVSDLTVCQVRMYLNGSEYDGISEIEDGSYTLLITAEDELGHTSEKSATFVLDTKEPIFIVTGVEDGEVRNDSYSIEVSLQLDEDTLEEVKLNDTVITVKNNVASLSVSDKGEYKLYMKATDEAGNEAEQTITFTFGEEQKSVTTAVSDAVEKAASHWWIWAIVVAAILAVGGLIFFILKRRKED